MLIINKISNKGTFIGKTQIKKETGNTPKDLIALHIINVAKHRLVSTNEDVAIIAYDLGFEYPAHFSRMFKRITGQSPSQFRSDIVRTQ